jgi:guanylate kinase
MMNAHYSVQLTTYPLLIVISGPSGVGKDSIVQALKSQKGMPFHFVVTATNREPRPEERQGVDYLFVSTEEFTRMIEADELVEYARVYNDYKGVPKSQLRQAFQSGKDVIMRVDVQGAATLHDKYPDALLIYLTASEEDLLKRLRARKTDSDEALRLRVAMGRSEATQLDEFDYVVENAENCLDQAVETILAIIEAEHHRVQPRKVML